MTAETLNRVIADREDLRSVLEDVTAKRDRLQEALTPSAETKAAYMGEFSFEAVPDIKVFVPWITVKEIMKAIRDRAALQESVND